MRRLAWILTAGMLAGCGGGGGRAVPSAPGARAPRTVQVAFSIAVPRSGGSALRRRPAYISPDTRSVVVDVTASGAPTTRTIIPCANSTCTGTVPAVIGVDTFAIALNDRLDGSGATLSAGTTTATVVEGGANAVSVTFNGVVARLVVSLDDPNPTVNAAATTSVRVIAFDADGNVIIGPGAYDSPIALSDGDTSGATALSTKTIASPSDPPPALTYSGAWIGGSSASAVITASVPANAAVTPAVVQLVPAAQAVEYAIPTASAHPLGIAAGSDGALWFTEPPNDKVGRITTGGTITEYVAPPGNLSQPTAITAGGDGNLWFSDLDQFDESIDQITTAGAITRHSIKLANQTRGVLSLAWGADGNIWGTDHWHDTIIRLTPSGVETDFVIPSIGANVQGITAGPDGALWFTEYYGHKIGRITTSGTISEYPITGQSPPGFHSPLGITSGPDKALWFIDDTYGIIGHATTQGTISEFPGTGITDAKGSAIVTGPDGAIWFTQGNSSLGRIAVDGTEQSILVPTLQRRSGSYSGLALGGDGSLWYTDSARGVIGKIVL